MEAPSSVDSPLRSARPSNGFDELCAGLEDASLAALERIVQNLRKSPREPKYRVLRLENASVRDKLLRFPGAVAFLARLGFAESDGGFLALNGALDDGARGGRRRPKARARAPRGRRRRRRRRARARDLGRERRPGPRRARRGLDDRGAAAARGGDDDARRIAVEGGPRWSDRALLLYGPPGCGKTSLVECLAAEWGRGDLVTVHGAELYSRFSVSKFGEARRHYDRARQLAPAVLHVKGLDLALGDVLAHLGGADRDDRADRARAIARGVADPADDLDFLDLAAQMDGFSYRAVAEACAAATRSARRRSPKRGRRVLCDDFDDVLDAAAEGLVCDWVDGGLAWRATTPAAERVLARYAATITVEEDDDGTTLRSPV
ncbi:ATP binding protein [Aureococcus anophagefferens]|uniref:ATP binding protein n=1 Tax=Aureococcus anophagefferens TaxID=44056 RepID=A0ABR1G288_AURAN